MRKAMTLAVFTVLLTICASSCDYDEEVKLCNVVVRLVGRPNAVTKYEPTADIEVQLTDATSSVFIGKTELMPGDNDGDTVSIARFRIPAGLYSGSVSFQRWGEKDERYPTSTRYWYYIYNGNIANRVVSTDSVVNQIDLTVTVVRQSRFRTGV